MVDVVRHWSCTHASRLIGVETPAIILVILDCFADILVMLNFHADVFFQLDFISLAAFRNKPVYNSLLGFFKTVLRVCKAMHTKGLFVIALKKGEFVQSSRESLMEILAKS